MPKSKTLQWLRGAAAFLLGAVLIGGAGWLFLGKGMGRFFFRVSYDLPFHFPNPQPAPEDLCIIYMTDAAAKTLKQPFAVWKRTLHAELIRRLLADRPRAILFDVVFSDPSLDPASDPDFAEAIREAGCVYLAGQLELENTTGSFQERVIAPLPMFRRVAAGWGLAAFRPVDEDYGVRYLYTGTEEIPTVTWDMAAKLGAPLPKSPEGRAAARWVNYYGAVDVIPHFSYDVALDPANLPAGYFKDKVIFIGGRSSIGVNLGRDEFHHPLTRWSRRDENDPRGTENGFVPGLEVHATIFANLYRGEWLDRLPDVVENALILLFGVALAAILPRFTPLKVAGLTLLISLGFAAAAVLLMKFERIWFNWAVPVMVQAPIGLGWAIGSRYFLIERRRDVYRKAFAAYLSPHLATRVELEQLNLAPGGTMEDVSIIFTDLEGFTALSEEMNDATRTADLLTHYFTRTTAHVLESDGTMIKYIGDAVFAIWGQPLRDSRHPIKAARAACRMHLESEREIDGRRLHTRIAVHTGRVLVGNLGSLQRFDYSCIGDAVNFASRLEGLNKYLGTSILISDDLFRRLNGEFVTRHLGAFRVVGRKTPENIHQLLGEKAMIRTPEYLGTFAQAVKAYQQRDFDEATALFEQVIRECGGEKPDGPSAFYLKQIEVARKMPPGEEWDGVVEITSK